VEIEFEEVSNLPPPLSWRLKQAWLSLRIPLAIAIAVLAWIYVPQFEARKEQNALAEEFFAQCAKMLKDTDQLPKVPDEALNEALRKRPLTKATVQAWAPQVWSEIQKGKWVAHIQFAPPTGYAVENTIGPALAEAGYDTPSAGP
jgi:hypothetical protein